MIHAEQAHVIVGALEHVIDDASRTLALRCQTSGRLDPEKLDDHQAPLFDLATASSAVRCARALANAAADDAFDAACALAYAAYTAVEVDARISDFKAPWAPASTAALEPVRQEIAAGHDEAVTQMIADAVLDARGQVPSRLPEELDVIRQTFRRFADEQVRPIAEEIHRTDADIPESLITALSGLGCFALSVPVEYGGLDDGGEDALLNMVIVTEELSRASLAAAGSLITRPEIAVSAMVSGATAAQRQSWLPGIAAGERMCAIAVTEPDHGSDVAGITTTAVRDDDGWLLNGTKSWCTFAGRAELLLVLARTDPDRSARHRGLSLFVIEKPPMPGRQWRASQPQGGTMSARAIPTLGYRGMHSFEVSIDRWRVPHSALVGEDDGIGRGFYLQMQAFANGRLQTAARAQGLMQAALECTVDYATHRTVFGQPLASHGLSKAKIARMAVTLRASRAHTYEVARRMSRGAPEAPIDAANVKLFACRAAEWITREAQQFHGAYGYAEEFTVSRLFVDARVLPIFEGTEEVLALKVIGRWLVEAST